MEKTILNKINTIHTIQDLKRLSRDFTPDRMEQFARTTYLEERCNQLHSNLSSLKSEIGTQLPDNGRLLPEDDSEQSFLKAFARQYHLSDEHMARCM